ncbi:hypothetical protein [Bradyrhizobium genosp. A]|uniref:hypothetical protein n=1 Tax=Bradyrhizobium genosp. A TaxID=83626 RepID=UPI003CED4587
MIWGALQSLWHFLFGWAGVDMLIGFACVAIAVLTPPAVVVFIPDLRKWAIYGAVVSFTLMGSIAYGYKNGSDEKQRQWDAAQAREAVNGETARSDAERAMPDTADRRMLDTDPRNRDGGKHATEHQGPLRRLAPNHLFGR